MSTSQIITIAVAVLVVAAIGLVLTGVRRTDVRGVGSLARETRKKDRGKVNPEAMTGRQVEAAASASRSVVLAAPKAEIEPWSPPDAEALGVTRRQFFNRASVTLMSASLGGFGAAVIAFLWKGSSGGFGSKITMGNIEDRFAPTRVFITFLKPAHGLPNIRAKVCPKLRLFTARRQQCLLAWKQE